MVSVLAVADDVDDSAVAVEATSADGANILGSFDRPASMAVADDAGGRVVMLFQYSYGFCR